MFYRSAFRIAQLTCSRASHNRGIAWLTEYSEFLPKLLAQDGLSKFTSQSGSSTASAPKLLASFAIDRNEVCIRGSYALFKPNEKIKSDSQLQVDYPPYTPSALTPTLRLKEGSLIPSPLKIQELSEILWQSFCEHDFLTLKVEAFLNPDGTMSFGQCSATVDESAVHRQAEIFKHTTRKDHPDEVEAEKSLLVLRK
jgi:hypothetical protein